MKTDKTDKKPWTGLDRMNWIDSLGLGILVPQIPKGSTGHPEPCENPTPEQIQNLASIREKLAVLAPGSNASLLDVLYTSENEEYSAIQQVEIEAQIVTPDGVTVTAYFHA